MHLATNEWMYSDFWIHYNENKIKLKSASHWKGKMVKGYWTTEHVHIPYTAKYKIQ